MHSMGHLLPIVRNSLQEADFANPADWYDLQKCGNVCRR